MVADIQTKELKYQRESNKALTVQQNNKTLLCAAAVGSGSCQSVLEAFTLFSRSGNILKHDKAVIICLL